MTTRPLGRSAAATAPTTAAGQVATSLASSAQTEHQAFRHGDHAYGILFHLEATPAKVHVMVGASGDELAGAGVSAEELLDDPPVKLEHG